LPIVVAVVVSPAALLVPSATAPLKNPSAVAVVPSPIPTAKLVGVLMQPPPLLMPLIEAPGKGELIEPR
jgi:hypothetical protein